MTTSTVANVAPLSIEAIKALPVRKQMTAAIYAELVDANGNPKDGSDESTQPSAIIEKLSKLLPEHTFHQSRISSMRSELKMARDKKSSDDKPSKSAPPPVDKSDSLAAMELVRTFLRKHGGSEAATGIVESWTKLLAEVGNVQTFHKLVAKVRETFGEEAPAKPAAAKKAA